MFQALSEKYRLFRINGKVFTGVLCLLFFNGCGYTLNHRLLPEFQGHAGYFVPVFQNNTYETGAEIVFTNAFVYEMESHGETILDKKGEEGVLLEGTLESLAYSAESQSDIGTIPGVRIADQIGVTAVVRFKMTNLKTKKIILDKPFSSYRRTAAPTNRKKDHDAPSSLALITHSMVENTYNDIARQMMRDVYDSMVNFN